MAKILRHEISLKSGTDATDSGQWVYVTANDYGGSITSYFEAVIKVTSGTGYLYLNNSTNGTTYATITVTETSYTLKRVSLSTSIPAMGATLHIYYSGTGTAVLSARLIILETYTNEITKTTEQIELGQYMSTSSTSAVPTTNPKYFTYNSADYTGTITASFYACGLTTDTMYAGTVYVEVDDGSWANWTSAGSGSFSAASNTAVTGSVTLTNGRHYRATIKSGSSMVTAYLNCLKLIIAQAETITERISSTVGTVQLYKIQGGTGSSSETEQAICQTIVPASDYSITRIKFRIGKSGSPTDNLIATIHETSETGTIIGTSETVDSSTLSASGANALFYFTGGVSLTSGTTYYVVVERSGARDTSNYAKAYGANPSSISGLGRYRSNNTWADCSSVTVADYSIIVESVVYITKSVLRYMFNNTADIGTGLQGYTQTWDSTEWAGVTNVYKYAHDATNASDSSKLVDITADPDADITNATVTGLNQQVGGSAFTMPTTGHVLDINVTNSTGVLAATYIFVYMTVSTGTTTQKALTATVNITATRLLMPKKVMTNTIKATATFPARKVKRTLSSSTKITATVTRKAKKVLSAAITNITATMTKFRKYYKTLTNIINITATRVIKGKKVIASSNLITSTPRRKGKKVLSSSVLITSTARRAAKKILSSAIINISSTMTYFKKFYKTLVAYINIITPTAVAPTYEVADLAKSLEYCTYDSSHQSLIKIDSTHCMLACNTKDSGGTPYGTIITFSIDANGNITLLHSLNHVSSSVTVNSLVMIDSTHVALAFAGESQDGYLKTFSIDGSYNIAELDVLEFDPNSAITALQMVKISSNHIAVVHNGGAGHLKIETYEIDVTYNIAIINAVEYETTNASYCSIALLDSTHLMIAYAASNGKIKIYSIDENADNIALVEDYTFDSTGWDTRIYVIDSSHVMVAYSNVVPGTLSSLQSLVYDGSYQLSSLSTINHSAFRASDVSFAYIDSNHALLAHNNNSNNYGYLKTIFIGLGYILEIVDDFEIASNYLKSSPVQVSSELYAVAFSGVDADGFINTYSVDAIGIDGAVTKKVKKILLSTNNIIATATKKAKKIAAASVLITSTMIHKAKKILSGNLSITSTILHKVGKILSSSTLITSTMLKYKKWIKSLTATLLATATITKKGKKVLASSNLITATPRRQAKKILSSSTLITATMTKFKKWIKSLTANLTITSTITKKAKKVMANTITIASSITRKIGKVLSSGITITATFLKYKVWAKALTASITITSTVTRGVKKALSASINILATFIAEFKTGIQTFYKTLTASINIGSSITKKPGKVMASNITITGTVTKGVKRILNATINITATTAKKALKVLSAGITILGTFTWQLIEGIQTFYKTMVANISIQSSAAKAAKKNLSGDINITSSTTKKASKILATSLSILSAAAKKRFVTLVAGINIASSFTRKVGKSMMAQISILGTFIATFIGIIRKTLTANIGISSTVNKKAQKQMSGDLIVSSSLVKKIGKVLTANISIMAIFRRFIAWINMGGVSKAVAEIWVKIDGVLHKL